MKNETTEQESERRGTSELTRLLGQLNAGEWIHIDMGDKDEYRWRWVGCHFEMKVLFNEIKIGWQEVKNNSFLINARKKLAKKYGFNYEISQREWVSNFRKALSFNMQEWFAEKEQELADDEDYMRIGKELDAEIEAIENGQLALSL